MTGPADGAEVHRLCVFDLWLNCGHIATVAVDGWYPVTVACCERLGGTVLRGQYVPYASHVDCVTVLSEDYQARPTGSPPDPTRLMQRRPRTDEPCPPGHTLHQCSAGRYPAWVGAMWNLDDTRRHPPRHAPS
jgi:hypothetical protein